MVQTFLLFDNITNEKTLKFLQLDIFTRHPDLQVREKYRLILQFHLFRKNKRIKTFFTMTIRICVICLCQKNNLYNTGMEWRLLHQIITFVITNCLYNCIREASVCEKAEGLERALVWGGRVLIAERSQMTAELGSSAEFLVTTNAVWRSFRTAVDIVQYQSKPWNSLLTVVFGRPEVMDCFKI